MMSSEPGRNDPCPCGSGKKYKHCHGRPQPVDEGAHAGAVSRALDWLQDRHRKGLKAAYQEHIDDLWPEGVDQEMPEDTFAMVATNVGEWLLAEGEIEVRGQSRDINDYLLGPDGPLLTRGQKRWIAQLAERPLRLYTITDVRRGEGMTLVDALDDDRAPVEVQERSGSESARPGILLGARLMAVDEHWELSGAAYPFSMLSAPALLAHARELLADEDLHPEDRSYALGIAIGRAWLAQLLGATPIPALVDASTGEPLLLVSDHYEVRDAAALATALAACPDVVANTVGGWHRETTLGNKTPRQAIATPAGLERVKGLLRSYADGEAEMARAQGRSEVSYQFLWDALGITP